MYVASNGFKTAVILQDPEPMHPRHDYDNPDKMICWHSRQNLGDTHKYKDSHDFGAELARDLVPLRNMLEFVQAGKASGLRFVEEGDNLRLQAYFQFGSAEGTWHDMETCVTKDLDLLPGISSDIAKTEITDECYARENLQMCVGTDQLVILPLYLYDHSMQSISCDSFVGRAHHADWDSSHVGYIYMTKGMAMENLCNVNDQIRLAMPIHGADIHIPCTKDAKQDDVLVQQGYIPVCAADIVNPDKADPNDNSRILAPDWIEQDRLYKKDNYLFLCQGRGEDELIIRKVASFNPGLESLRDDNWKERAESCMRSSVASYDNYLRGNVYGFQAFEGFEEIDSCWSYDPGTRDIREFCDDMFGDWGEELREQLLHAHYESNENFDIEEFLEDNHFPEFEDKIRSMVLDLVSATESSGVTWPYVWSADQIRNNFNDVLDDIVADLYAEHVIPEMKDIHKVAQKYAGISLDYQPTISTADMEAGKRYTVDELLDIVKHHGVALADAEPFNKFLEKDLDR